MTLYLLKKTPLKKKKKKKFKTLKQKCFEERLKTPIKTTSPGEGHKTQ